MLLRMPAAAGSSGWNHQQLNHCPAAPLPPPPTRLAPTLFCCCCLSFPLSPQPLSMAR